MAVPKKAAQRIAAGVRKYREILRAARDRDVNESDTVVILADFLSEVLGFDKYSEVTTEFAVRGSFCDLAVKVGGKVEFLIEAKAIGVTLKERHLRQAIGYASQNGVVWVVLATGAVWNVYRMRFEKPVAYDLVFSVDLLDPSQRDGEIVERFFLLSREGISRSAIEEFQQERAALNPVLIAAVVLSDPVLRVLRRELKRISPKASVDGEQLAAVLRDEVLKRDVVEGEGARQAGGQVRRAAGRLMRRRLTQKEGQTLTATPVAEQPVPVPKPS